MLINQDLAAFMASPVMIILGTRDGSLAPEIARAVGAVVHREECCVDLIVSEWQWTKTVSNIRANGQLAVTFARPSDYVSYQVKGCAVVVPTAVEHVALAGRYMESMASTLSELGLERGVVAPWLVGRDLVTLRLSAQEIFVQTPGAKAGQLIERQP
ncbi:pyridoxamine 5'-phosphate oxidase family protein [Microvirga roseola]|uniref:pyridoxamine 5'-phosphate oxidase family protein n=1 Tax=Microvirga roseola TaxID=2883126 RepID=UPI001E2B63AB|nr:pyridoxamine 5'-phosphate oxidase family protein [Microvirga roseola]